MVCCVREREKVEKNQKTIQVKKIKATKKVTSDELANLSNEEIALLLYFLVANGTCKTFNDFYDIGNKFSSIAANLKK